MQKQHGEDTGKTAAAAAAAASKLPQQHFYLHSELRHLSYLRYVPRTAIQYPDGLPAGILVIFVVAKPWFGFARFNCCTNTSC